MSSSLNRAQILGNLTKDPEIRETPNGAKVATFSIATNRTWKDAAGAKQEQVEYHSVVCWQKLAEIAEQYLMKGKKVYIEGRLQTRSWDAQDGTKRYKTEIVCENLIMLASPQSSNAPPPGDDDFPPTDFPPDAVQVQSGKERAKQSQEEIALEDIPF